MDNSKLENRIIGADELAGVTGGAETGDKTAMETKYLYCDDPKCKQERLFYLGSGGRATCSFCHTQIMY